MRALFVLSPAKTLDFETPVPEAILATTPKYLPQAARLVALLKAKSASQLAEFMEISNALAVLNVARFKAWRASPTEKVCKQAILAFDGDVYDGLDAKTLKTLDLAWAQDHVCILSGLYGALRPLDLIQPHRLEMGRPLATSRGSNLYHFWGSTQALHFNDALEALKGAEPSTSDTSEALVVNLASAEYFKSVQTKFLNARVVECVFEDLKSGQYKVISFNAKRARGKMARFAIQKRITSVKKLQAFTGDGYLFSPAVSTKDRLVFRRAA